MGNMQLGGAQQFGLSMPTVYFQAQHAEHYRERQPQAQGQSASSNPTASGDWMSPFRQLWRSVSTLWGHVSAYLPFQITPAASQPHEEEMELVSGPSLDSLSEPQREMSFFPPFLSEESDRIIHSPQKRTDFPSMGSENIPIQGSYRQEKVVILPDGHMGLPLYQYGKLNEHGAFWLENERDDMMGLFHRTRTPKILGEKAPRTFYQTSFELPIELPDAALAPETRRSIKNYLVGDAIRQAKQNYIRLMIEPRDVEDEALLRQHGFVDLQAALNRYVPHGEHNPSREDEGERTHERLVFDGVLDGYGANFFRRNAVNSAISRS